MSIIIVGLGPGNKSDLTLRAWETLSGAKEVYLRTDRHPIVPELPKGPVYHTFDELYEQAEDFGALYNGIARRIIELGRGPDGVVYAVPGHPLVGEATVTRILELAHRDGIKVEIIGGLSFIEPVLSALGLDGLEGLQVLDAIEVAAMHHPPINPDAPALLAQVYNKRLASDLKLTLMNQYRDEYKVTLIHAAGTPDERIETIPLYRIDHSEHISHLTTLYIPPMPVASGFQSFQETIAHLRAPDGCPWDRRQTHQSLRRNLLEETYEVLEAIDAGNPDAMCEELGDLLLQIVLHAQIAVDEGEFHMADVIASINSKIIRRHPHVWGDVEAGDAQVVIQNWEKLKEKERRSNGQTDRSLLDGVPGSLPALSQALAYQERAARVHFDWDSADAVLERVCEEMAEAREAGDEKARAAEVGDVLFSLVNWARWLNVDPESALREANRRFYRRFRHIERRAAEQGRSITDLSLDEMDALWEEAKSLE